MGMSEFAGVMTYTGLSGSNNEYLHIVLTLAAHQLGSIGQMYIDGNLATLQSGQYPYYALEVDLGNPSESTQPFPGLAAAIPSWNSNCLQRGCAKVHVTLKYDVKVYPNGCPGSIAFDVTGRSIYDPRSSTTAYSDNPALCIRDFLIDQKFGLGVNAATIDDSYTIAAANICDEMVAVSSGNTATIGTCTHSNVTSGICTITATNNLKIGALVTLSGFAWATWLNGLSVQVTACTATQFQFPFTYSQYDHTDSGTATAPTTQKAYTCDGVFDAGQARGNVLTSMASAMAGYIIPPGDMWRIYAGSYVTPTIILTQDDLRGPVKMDTLVSKRELANAIQGTFVSPANSWQSASYPPYVDATAVTTDGGTRIWQNIDLPFTTDGIRTQRIAKIYLERIPPTENADASMQTHCLSAAARRHGDVHVRAVRIHEKIFEVIQCSVVQASSNKEQIFGVSSETSSIESGVNKAATPEVPTLGVDLTLRETDSGVYSWNPSTDENTWTAPIPTTLPSLLTAQPVTGVTAVSNPSTAIVRADGIISDRILVGWTSPADQYVIAGGKIQIWTRPHAVSASDPFSGSSLGSNWTVNEGSFIESSGVCQLSATGTDYRANAWWNAETFNPDQYAQCTVAAIGTNGLGPCVRMLPSGETYYCGYRAGTMWYLFK